MAAFEEYLRASSRGARHDSALRFDKYDLGTVFSSTFSEEGAVQNQARAYVAQIRDRLNLKD